jgi:hypothetical protein
MKTDDSIMIEDSNGDKQWWLNDERHREDGPAIENSDGYMQWWFHGKLHRIDGPAKERPDGFNSWFLHGRFHREDGPAVDYPDGTKMWYVHGKRHRKDGPGVLGQNLLTMEPYSNENRWYLRDQQLSQFQFTNILIQHHLKLRLLHIIIPNYFENLVNKFEM